MGWKTAQGVHKKDHQDWLRGPTSQGEMSLGEKQQTACQAWGGTSQDSHGEAERAGQDRVRVVTPISPRPHGNSVFKSEEWE